MCVVPLFITVDAGQYVSPDNSSGDNTADPKQYIPTTHGSDAIGYRIIYSGFVWKDCQIIYPNIVYGGNYSI